MNSLLGATHLCAIIEHGRELVGFVLVTLAHVRLIIPLTRPIELMRDLLHPGLGHDYMNGSLKVLAVLVTIFHVESLPLLVRLVAPVLHKLRPLRHDAVEARHTRVAFFATAHGVSFG